MTSEITAVDTITPTEHELRQAFAKAVEEYRAYHRSAAWNIGDRALALQDHKRALLKAEADELRARADNCTDDQDGAQARRDLLDRAHRLESDSALSGYTRELCDAHKIDSGYVTNCVMLARFYPVSLRNDTLLIEHHIVAMKAAGGAKSTGQKAQAWLTEAERETLSASELRRRVNIALATHTPAKGKPEKDPYAALTAADTWAIGYRSKVSELTPEQRMRMLSLMRGLLDLADALRAGG
jgi:hypothetical protein